MLVLLAAVLAMHGTPCLAGNSGEAPMTMGPAGVSTGAPAVAVGHVAVAQAAVVTGQPAVVNAGPRLPAGRPPLAGSAPHDSMGTWATCLAVLLAGIVGAAALLTGRAPRAAVAGLLDRGRAFLRAVAPPSPPDLSVLCLLRV